MQFIEKLLGIHIDQLRKKKSKFGIFIGTAILISGVVMYIDINSKFNQIIEIKHEEANYLRQSASEQNQEKINHIAHRIELDTDLYSMTPKILLLLSFILGISTIQISLLKLKANKLLTEDDSITNQSSQSQPASGS